MRDKPKSFIIKCIPYHFDIFVSAYQTDEDLIKGFKKYTNSEEDISGILNLPEINLGKYIFLNSGRSIIRLMPNNNAITKLGCIVHECFHATTYILHNVGMVHDVNTSEEAYSYFQEYLVTTILTELTKK